MRSLLRSSFALACAPVVSGSGLFPQQERGCFAAQEWHRKEFIPPMLSFCCFLVFGKHAPCLKMLTVYLEAHCELWPVSVA